MRATTSPHGPLFGCAPASEPASAGAAAPPAVLPPLRPAWPALPASTKKRSLSSSVTGQPASNTAATATQKRHTVERRIERSVSIAHSQTHLELFIERAARYVLIADLRMEGGEVARVAASQAGLQARDDGECAAEFPIDACNVWIAKVIVDVAGRGHCEVREVQHGREAPGDQNTPVQTEAK